MGFLSFSTPPFPLLLKTQIESSLKPGLGREVFFNTLLKAAYAPWVSLGPGRPGLAVSEGDAVVWSSFGVYLHEGAVDFIFQKQNEIIHKEAEIRWCQNSLCCPVLLFLDAASGAELTLHLPLNILVTSYERITETAASLPLWNPLTNPNEWGSQHFKLSAHLETTILSFGSPLQPVN